MIGDELDLIITDKMVAAGWHQHTVNRRWYRGEPGLPDPPVIADDVVQRAFEDGWSPRDNGDWMGEIDLFATPEAGTIDIATTKEISEHYGADKPERS